MLKLGRVTKVKVFFLVLVYVFNIDLFEFSAAILEMGLFDRDGGAACKPAKADWTSSKNIVVQENNSECLVTEIIIPINSKVAREY